MIALLNILPLLIAIVWVVIWRISVRGKSGLVERARRAVWVVAGFIASMLLYTLFQPSYLPKGEVRRNDVPTFERSDAGIHDRVKRTNADEHYRRAQEMHDRFMKD